MMLKSCFVAAAILVAMAPAAGASPAEAGGKSAAVDKATSQPVTVIPADRPKKARFAQRHKENLERKKQGPIDLLFMGDSITDRWSSAPKVWEQAFGKWHPANFGVGGDRTENVIWRITHGELDGISPKVMVLMIGTNNTHTSPAPDIVAGIKKIIEISQRKMPKTKILLLAVFPREPRVKNGVANAMPTEKVREINKLLPALADGERVRFLDIGDKFLVDGKVPKDVMPDGLHPNEKGYKIWAKAITPVLEEMMK